MIWKILFYISTLIMIFMNLFDFINSSNISITSEWSFLFGLILFGTFVLITSACYGLGWQKKIYTNKTINIVQYCFAILILLFFANSLTAGFRQYFGENWLFVLINISTLALVLLIFSLPFVIFGFITIKKYKEKFEKFENVENPLLKVAVFGFLVYFISHFINVFILRFNHLIIYNIFDFLIELSYIYTGLFLIGYAFNKKIFNQLFWKISSFIYAPVLVFSPFLVSIPYADDTFLSQTQTLFSYNILCILCAVFFFYALYEYVFTNKFFLQKNNQQ